MSEDEDSSENLVKGISLTPVITSLLKPSADLLGVELRDFLKQKIDDVKVKRKARNLEGHIRKVKDRLDETSAQFPRRQESVESVEQLELFEDWVDGAEAVDPDDKILSSMWEDLLYKMAVGEWPTRALIETMKKLDSRDAKILVSLKSGDNRWSYRSMEGRRYRLERLVNLGLVRKQYFSFKSILPLSAAMVATLIAVAYIPNIVNSALVDRLAIPMYLAILIAAAVMIARDRDRFVEFSLSELGYRIVSYADRTLHRDHEASSSGNTETAEGRSANPGHQADG